MTRHDKDTLVIANHDGTGDHALHIYADPDTGAPVMHTTGRPIHLTTADVAVAMAHLAGLSMAHERRRLAGDTSAGSAA